MGARKGRRSLSKPPGAKGVGAGDGGGAHAAPGPPVAANGEAGGGGGAPVVKPRGRDRSCGRLKTDGFLAPAYGRRGSSMMRTRSVGFRGGAPAAVSPTQVGNPLTTLTSPRGVDRPVALRRQPVRLEFDTAATTGPRRTRARGFGSQAGDGHGHAQGAAGDAAAAAAAPPSPMESPTEGSGGDSFAAAATRRASRRKLGGAGGDNTETSTALPLKTSRVWEGEGGGLVSLSVCPGKQMSMGRNGKSYARSLRQDVLTVKERLKLTHIVCLLNHSELRCLGVSPEGYMETCRQLNIAFVHYPMVEMAAPKSPAQLDDEIIAPMVREVREGGSVLIHCRGGVGRAGLQAACMVMRLGEATTADEAIATIRQRRDPRAVESQTQINFVRKYAAWLTRAEAAEEVTSLRHPCVLPRPRSVRQAQPGVQVGNAMKLARMPGPSSPRGVPAAGLDRSGSKSPRKASRNADASAAPANADAARAVATTSTVV